MTDITEIIIWQLHMMQIGFVLLTITAVQALSGEDAAYSVINSVLPSAISSQFQLELDSTVDGFTV